MRIRQLLYGTLPGAKEIVKETDEALSLILTRAGLARVLVDHDEGLRRDRVRGRVARVAQREAQVRRERYALAGSRDRRDCRRHELARIVLHVGEREAVLQGIRLFDVADGARRLLDGGGDAVIALGARAGRPLHRLVGADLRAPLRALVGEEAREALRGAGLVGPV